MAEPDPTIASNALPNFQIGVSPIGAIPQFNWRDTVISQYANSPILLALIESFFSAVDMTDMLLDNFYSQIWDVDTAVGYGLDVWGRIVGVQRIVTAASPGFFGFEEQGPPQAVGFGQGPFYTGPPILANFVIGDDAFRQMVFAKALANVCDGSIPSINRILMTLFPNRGNAYVINNGAMSMTYYFNFALTPVELAIVQNAGVLPTPAGVSANVVVI